MQQQVNLVNGNNSKTSHAAKVLALAKRKHDSFMDDASALYDVVHKYSISDISDNEKTKDHEICNLMREANTWKQNLKDLAKKFNDFMESTVEHRLDDDLMNTAELEMESVRNGINKLVKAIAKEDKERNIRALDNTRAEQRKFKSFSGALGEDLLFFKNDFEEAVIANRITKSNQLEKLRECLSGEALQQVPKNMTGGLESAWNALKSMFGDPERLLKFRMKKLDDLGKFPPSMIGNTPNYHAQATWLAPFLVELNEVISLGEKHVSMNNTVFNSLTINNIISRFSEKDDLNTLDMVSGADKDKLLGIKASLETMKAKTIRFSARTASSASDVKNKGKPKENPGSASNVVEIKGMTVFKNPQTFSDCRICDLYVDNPPGTLQPYGNHLSNWITGCPIFMSLTTNEKYKKAREAEFCVNCFDNNIKFSGGQHINKDDNVIVKTINTILCFSRLLILFICC